MATTAKSVADVCQAAREASRALATASDQVKDAALEAMASALEQRLGEVLEANERDMAAGVEAGLSAALLDRLKLDEARVRAIAADVRKIAALPDPVGEVLEGWRLENGLEMRKLRVPLGVVAVVYEARPNVTIDCSALCLKSGNAIVLRGSSMAMHSNAVLAEIAASAVETAGLPREVVSLVAGGGREELAELATQAGVVDLIIPRGGEGLKAALQEVATVPVIYAAAGNCHVYVDASAHLDDALRIVLNAKVQRPGVCNSAETLLVHADAAPEFLPRVLGELREAGVELRVDARTRALARAEGAQPGPHSEERHRGGDPASTAPMSSLADSLGDADEDDWATEYLALILAVKVVDSLDEAIDHVNRYSSGHSEAIVTDSTEAAERFTHAVDAACVYVNASTRFTDGGVFGMGAEIGNSTQKLHVRGPIGVRELTTYKYVAEGSGQIRE